MFEVSWSKIKTWRHCRKQYQYKYFERIQRKAPALPLIRGSALGEMLDARALGKDPKKVLAKYEKEYRTLFIEEQEMYGDFIGDLRRIFNNYVLNYKDEKLEYLGIEVEVRVKLTKSIEFHGYIDKIVKDKNGQLWELDHKSHKSIPDEDNRYSDLQQVFYTWAYNKMVKPKDQVSGVIWDYIKTKPPTIPESLKAGGLTKRANIDTTYETYLEEINRLKLNPKDYTEILTSLKKGPNTFFQRVKLPEVNGPMVETVVGDLIDTAEEIEVAHSIKPRDFRGVRNMTKDCSFCEFFELCQTELRGYDSSFIRKTKYVPRENSRDAHKK